MRSRNVLRFGPVVVIAALASACSPPVAPNDVAQPIDAGAIDAIDAPTLDAGSPADGFDATDAPPPDTFADVLALDHQRIGSHSMLITGAGAHLYASHLPAFYEPHRVQVIVEGHLDSPPTTLPTDFSTELFSLAPEAFSLDALRDGSLSQLRGTMYRGNLEQGGTMLASGVVFVVTRVVYQSELGSLTDTRQGYLVFGEAGALYAVHRIVGEPGYDHLVRVDVDPAPTGVDSTGSPLLLVRSTDDTVGNRIQSAAMFAAESGGSYTITPRVQLSCLVGPGFASLCP